MLVIWRVMWEHAKTLSRLLRYVLFVCFFLFLLTFWRIVFPKQLAFEFTWLVCVSHSGYQKSQKREKFTHLEIALQELSSVESTIAAPPRPRPRKGARQRLTEADRGWQTLWPRRRQRQLLAHFSHMLMFPNNCQIDDKTLFE